jgi:hypothetical protein
MFYEHILCLNVYIKYIYVNFMGYLYIEMGEGFLFKGFAGFKPYL